jgi:transcription elongation factor GreA
MTDGTTAPALLRSVGLLADGPAQWGRPIAAPGPGVFVVELAALLPSAPIELTRVGKWIERVGTLRLDGERPTSRALAARLASFWLPSQAILYVGSSETSIRRRLAAMVATELGDRRPSAGGHWLKVLRNLETARIWWAGTSAPEEYEDALLEAFADSVPASDRAGLPDTTVILPFGNLRRPAGERKATGLSGSLLAEPVETPSLPIRVVVVPDGDAEGARGEPPPPRRRPAESRANGAAPRRSAAARSAAARPAAAVEALTAEGAARLRAELEDLVRVRRPEVVARVRTAREHGDLKENAEYHAAREEQSFLEGRIQALEGRLRGAPIAEAPAEGRVGLGSRVTVEHAGERSTYTIVGAAESHPESGRISSSSPVGRALVGHDIGDAVLVRTPAGEQWYTIVDVG